MHRSSPSAPIASPTFAACAVVSALLLAAGVVVATETPVGRIEGVAVAGPGGRGIADASCTVAPAGLRAVTGKDGAFQFARVPVGLQTVACSKAGWLATSAAVAVVAGQTAQVRLVLPTLPKAADAPTRQDDSAKTEPAQPDPAAKRDKVSGGYGSAKAMVFHGSGTVSGGGKIALGAAGVGASVSVARSSAGMAYRVQPAPAAPAPADFNREGYDAIDESSFHTVRDQPLSTLSIDVDTAAYSNVRRFLTSGQLPPKDAVRIEELINYFPYAYPGPSDDEPFAVHTEVGAAPWNRSHRLVRVGIQGRRIDMRNLPPANLVFLIDVSGSMAPPDRLPLLQRSLALLTRSLRPQDKVAIVVYAGAAGLVLPSTPGSNQAAILGALERLRAGGSTAGGAGLQLAYDVAAAQFGKGAANRVILCTDGDFNVGVSSDGELVELIEKRRASGVFLTVLGFGTGNYQDGKMQKLADKGNGHHAYIDTLAEAQKVLVGEVGGTLLTIAQDVKIQVEFNPSMVKGYRLIGYENRLLAARDFNDDKKDAGELGAGHAVTALYEIVPASSPEPLAAVDRLKYQEPTLRPAAATGELMTVKLRFKPPAGAVSKLLARVVVDAGHAGLDGASEDFRFAAAVAAWGLLLRDSPFKGSATFALVGELARGAVGADPDGYRHELVSLVARSGEIPRP